jgi:peroxiredoxin
VRQETRFLSTDNFDARLRLPPTRRRWLRLVQPGTLGTSNHTSNTVEREMRMTTIRRTLRTIRSASVDQRVVALSAALLALLLIAPLHAGKYNTVLSVGDKAPGWTDLPGTDGRQHALADLADTPGVVVAFTCLSCPIAADYEARIEQLAQQYGGESGQVAFVAICVNRVEADRLPALTAHVKEHNLHFPFLYDESQQIARDYGAIYTPQFFVLDRDRKITYMGALDDSTDADKVTEHYLDEAIQATLAGRTPAVTETVPRGCTIRYERERRRRSRSDQ